MAWRAVMREGEVRIISVTPVAKGIVRPALLSIVTGALVIVGASHFIFIHQHRAVIALVAIGPFALVSVTRVWRWRSHKIHITTERIVIEGGVLHHQRSSVDLRDVVAIRVDQKVSERLVRRGLIVLQTVAGTIVVGKVRHPSALVRLIDAERSGQPSEPLPPDTVFTFEQPDAFDFRVRPQRRALRHPHE